MILVVPLKVAAFPAAAFLEAVYVISMISAGKGSYVPIISFALSSNVK